MKPALMVIDMREVFFDFSPAVSESLTLAVEYINGAIELFRGKDLPVFCIEDLEEEAGRVPGSKGFETTSKIDLLPTDPRIHKTYENAF
jgi:nicotinamidase-related amidase